MATFEPFRPSKDVKSDIKRLKGILDRQRQYLSALAIDNPEFQETQDLIKKTMGEIKKKEETLKESIKIETRVKAEEDLTSAEEDLKYAKASGDKKQIQKATNAFAVARNAAVKAGVTNKEGGLLGSEKTGGTVGKPAEPATKEQTPAGKQAVGTGTTGTKTGVSSKGRKAVEEEKPKAPTDVFAKGIEQFGAIDTVFKTVPELTDLLTKAVNEKWTPAKWTSELQNTSWFKSNATNLQQRGFYKRQYNDLVNAIPASDPDRQAKIDELRGTTTYGRGLDSTKRLIQNYAIQQGAVIDAAALDLMAQDIYDHALDNDALAIKSYVTSNIKYRPNAILSGKAGTDLADLKKTAIANGLDLDKAFGSSVQGWLQKLQSGESVETYKNIIRQAAKIGLPEKVASLLDNGVDLETVYAPYKNIMETTLELPKGSVQLTDPVLRSAISADKEMPIYEFERALRKDNRWQYTDQARQEVSQGIQKVLQDFGFQG